MIYDQDEAEDFALWTIEVLDNVDVYLAYCVLKAREEA
jgi:hypothetical protein